MATLFFGEAVRKAPPLDPLIVIRGAGEMGSAVAWRLYAANMRRLCLVDLPSPMCVRRTVAFSTALDEGLSSVEGVEAISVLDAGQAASAWASGQIPIFTVDAWKRCGGLKPDVLVDAILAKRNLGTGRDDARLVIGLGPGFVAGHDCHYVIETNRGHDMGRIITDGAAQPNTGIPGEIGGFTRERVLRAPVSGIFTSKLRIGDLVRQGACVGMVGETPVQSRLDGMLRGLIRSNTLVDEGVKLGDVDPRGTDADYLTISDKARALAGAVLEAVMREFNR